MLFMGVDVGSSGVKVSVINDNGNVVCFSTKKYSFTHEDGKSELCPNKVFENVLLAIKEISQKTDLKDVVSLSVTSFGEMFVLLDENKEVLCNSISYGDMRGSAEAEKMAAEFGNDRLYSITGATANAMYSLPKLLWIEKNMPEVYEKADKLCLFADFILIKLGAEFHIDYSLASRTLMFDVNNKCWSEDILEYAKIKRTLLSKPVGMGTNVGTIDSEIANELGLPEGLILLAGGHDQSCAALGAGIIKKGAALDGMGSNECIVPLFDKAMIDEKMKNSNLVSVPYMIPGMYVTYAFNRTSGTVLDWYKNLIGVDSYDELFDGIDMNPSKLLFLPHFAGAATPYMDDDAVGAMVGLNLGTSRAEITKALVEGLNFEVMINLQCLKDSGFTVDELYVSGGMSKNDKILQIKADILGIPIYRLQNSETGTVAMVILGSVAVGRFEDVQSAISELVRVDKAFYPNESLHKEYMESFDKYKKMYDSVKTITGRK